MPHFPTLLSRPTEPGAVSPGGSEPAAPQGAASFILSDLGPKPHLLSCLFSVHTWWHRSQGLAVIAEGLAACPWSSSLGGQGFYLALGVTAVLSTGPGTEVVFSQQVLTGWVFVGNREGIPLWESARDLFIPRLLPSPKGDDYIPSGLRLRQTKEAEVQMWRFFIHVGTFCTEDLKAASCLNECNQLIFLIFCFALRDMFCNLFFFLDKSSI